MSGDKLTSKTETEPTSEIVIRPQTAGEEFEYLTQVLGQLPWYEENGYTISLPSDPLLHRPIEPAERE